MLFEKSKFVEGDIISLKIVSGEEIIGKYVTDDDESYVLNKPLMLTMSKQGVAMMPLMMTVDPERDFKINKKAVLIYGETVKEVADQYVYQTTGIQPVGAGRIVTG